MNNPEIDYGIDKEALALNITHEEAEQLADAGVARVLSEHFNQVVDAQKLQRVRVITPDRDYVFAELTVGVARPSSSTAGKVRSTERLNIPKPSELSEQLELPYGLSKEQAELLWQMAAPHNRKPKIIDMKTGLYGEAMPKIEPVPETETGDVRLTEADRSPTSSPPEYKDPRGHDLFAEQGSDDEH